LRPEPVKDQRDEWAMPTCINLQRSLVYASIHPYPCQRDVARVVGDVARSEQNRKVEKERVVADVKIDDGIIKVRDLEIQDPKVAAVLAEYPEARWAEIMRRAIKIGLGYLKGGAAS
jgi:hypothetical protein